MANRRDYLYFGGFLIVAASMTAMFLVPIGFFVPAVFVSTTCMILVTFRLTRLRAIFRLKAQSIAIGLVSAVSLYAIFVLGNYGIQSMHPFGISTSNETSIYSLIGTHPISIQIVILIFDSLGYECYFRGFLQNFVQAAVKRPAIIGVFASSFTDALIHLATFNILWVITTVIVDVVWGLVYYYSRDLTASVSSHFIWDVMIFVLYPIR
jgi:membrane protease YdiL (CAAX protease family)